MSTRRHEQPKPGNRARDTGQCNDFDQGPEHRAARGVRGNGTANSGQTKRRADGREASLVGAPSSRTNCHSRVSPAAPAGGAAAIIPGHAQGGMEEPPT